MSRDSEPFLLSVKEDLSVINIPLKETQRIKYTCFNVSANFLILGATSGSLYVFRREPCTFLQILPNKEGSVAHIAISPNEKLFAFSTIKGMVCILERNAGPGARLIQLSREHLNTEVTDMKWNSEGNELYVGDSIGRISVVNIILFTAKHMFNTPTFMLMQLDSRVVQLDWYGSLLLVSTLTRCYVCNTHKEEYRQIGSKLRDGEYGACFLNSGTETVLKTSAFQDKRGTFSSLGFDQKFWDQEDYKDVKIFCARPGSRVWEVGVDGLVKNTHEFKHALATKPSKIINQNADLQNTQESDWKSQSFNFVKLYILSNKFVITFKSDGFYIFDPVKSSVVLWNNSFQDIMDCRVTNDSIYLRLFSGKIVAISFLSLEKFLVGSYLCENFDLCADICFTYQEYLIRQVATCSRLHLLVDLHEKLPADSSEKITEFLQELSKCYGIEKQKSQRLKSGIFLVGNFHSLFLKKGLQEAEVERISHDGENKVRKRSASLSLGPESNLFFDKPLNKSLSCSDLASIPNFSRSQLTSEMANQKLTMPPDEANGYSECDDFFSSELGLRLPFTGLKSPEAIQALKHISSSVSGKITSGKKSLKEKWQVLEDKMKNLTVENQQEPLDTKKIESNGLPGIINVPLESFKRDDIVHLKKNGVPKKVPYPKLETSMLIGLCVDIENCYRRGDDVTQQVYKFFDCVSTICTDYDDFSQSQSFNSSSSIYFCSAVKMFPFTHYFPIQCHVIRKILCKSFESNLIIEWYKGLCLEQVATQVKIPNYLHTTHSRASINVDAFLSNILRVFTELLDAEAIVNEIKKKTEEVPCYYLTLCTVLDLLEDGALNMSKSDGHGKWPLPLQLNAMFCVLRMGQPVTCSKMGEYVDLKDVLYLILRLQSRLEETGIKSKRAVIKCQTHFLSYIDNITDDTIIEAALIDKELSGYIIEGFEILNSSSLPEQSCLCGFPLLQYPVQVSHCPRIGELICNVFWKTNENELARIASRVPGMWSYIVRNRRNENVSEVLPLLVHVGAISEFDFLLPSFDRDLWERTINLLAKYQAGNCLNCNRSFGDFENLSAISWTALGLLMVKSLGAANAIQLLLKFESYIAPGKLDASFYQSCLLSRVVERYVPGLGSESVGAVLAGDLFKRQNCATTHPSANTTSSQALGLVEMCWEWKGLGKEMTEPYWWRNCLSICLEWLWEITVHDNLDSRSPGSNLLGLQTINTSPVPRKVARPTDTENSGLCEKSKPWRVCLNLASDVCLSCLLPLKTRALLHDGGLTSFRCGHTYHSICIKARANFCCFRCNTT